MTERKPAAISEGQQLKWMQGRDDKFVLESMVSHDNCQFCDKIVIPTGA
jgi:hypothetical protein